VVKTERGSGGSFGQRRGQRIRLTFAPELAGGFPKADSTGVDGDQSGFARICSAGINVNPWGPLALAADLSVLEEAAEQARIVACHRDHAAGRKTWA
jgi:hypothetical protein